MKRTYEVYDVVTTLIGPVNAAGDSGIDAKRLENLKELTELIDKLLFDVLQASGYANRQESSMKAIGKYAANFLAEIRERT